MMYDIEEERKKLVDQLQIPIDRIEFENLVVELFDTHHSIGRLRYSSTYEKPNGKSIIKYETSEIDLNQLDWDFTCTKYAYEIEKAIAKAIGKTPLDFTTSAFGHVYVTPTENAKPELHQIAYDGEKWKANRIL